MLVRMILGIVIVVSSSLIGFIKGMQYEERVKELDNIISSINILETEIVYYQNPLPDALKRSSERCKGIIAPVYEMVAVTLEAKEGERLDSIWNRVINSGLSVDALNKKDISIISDFGRELGLGNVKEQSKYFEYMKMLLGDQKKIAVEERNKNSRLYKRLGVLLGISIFIIII